MRAGAVLASLAVLLTLSGCDRHREDAEIINTAIRHLSGKWAENSRRRGGILLVHTRTQSWTEALFPKNSIEL